MMKTNIFIPKKINIGFQERNDTYTKMLAYVIYFDEKGKLRKETSWNSWRNKKIENQIHENEPTFGFVLNKKAGGYSTGWNHRQTYVRVYDPRGFEFEITVSNLLYILENTTSTKGKGLEGEFVYGWDGKDLVLIPTESPDYIEISKLNEIIHENNFIKAKDLKIGATYLTKNNESYVYMGKFDEYDSYNGQLKKGKSFFFVRRNKRNWNAEEYLEIKTLKSMSKQFISCSSEECVENYAELFDELECSTVYSPIDSSKDEYIPYTLDEMRNKLDGENSRWKSRYFYVYTKMRGIIEKTEIDDFQGKGQTPRYSLYEKRISNGYWGEREYQENVRHEVGSLEELYEIVKPLRKRVYLANGKIYKEEG